MTPPYFVFCSSSSSLIASPLSPSNDLFILYLSTAHSVLPVSVCAAEQWIREWAKLKVSQPKEKKKKIWLVLWSRSLCSCTNRCRIKTEKRKKSDKNNQPEEGEQPSSNYWTLCFILFLQSISITSWNDCFWHRQYPGYFADLPVVQLLNGSELKAGYWKVNSFWVCYNISSVNKAGSSKKRINSLRIRCPTHQITSS